MTEPKAKVTFKLPPRAKLSKAAGTDPTRPVLQHAHVIEDADGKRTINVTDSYRLVQYEVPAETPIGPVNIAAIKRIETGAEYEIVGTAVEVIDKATNTKIVYPAPADIGPPPKYNALWPELEKGEKLVRIGINAEFLKGVADALGANKRAVILDILVKDGTTMRPIHVHSEQDASAGANGRAGLIMPVRIPKAKP